MTVLALVCGLVLHEYAHAVAAHVVGDRTPEACGRLTLNPLAHLHPMGSVLIPALTWPLFGWAVGFGKPVPLSRRLIPGERVVILMAGPVANLLLAVAAVPSLWWDPAMTWVQVNLILATVNLLPLPWLDGGRIAAAVWEGVCG